MNSPESNSSDLNALQRQYEKEKLKRLMPDDLQKDNIVWFRVRRNSGQSFRFDDYIVQITNKDECNKPQLSRHLDMS